MNVPVMPYGHVNLDALVSGNVPTRTAPRLSLDYADIFRNPSTIDAMESIVRLQDAGVQVSIYLGRINPFARIAMKRRLNDELVSYWWAERAPYGGSAERRDVLDDIACAFAWTRLNRVRFPWVLPHTRIYVGDLRA